MLRINLKTIMLFLSAALFIIVPIDNLSAQTCQNPSVPIADGLEGAFLTIPASMPSPAYVDFTSKEEGEVYSFFALPGYVTVVTANTVAVSEAQNLFSSHGGTIVAQIPKGGLYWVQVTAGQENAFITSINPEASVLDAFPTMLEGPASMQYLSDLSTLITSRVPFLMSGDKQQVVQFDLGVQLGDPNCPPTHREAVYDLLTFPGLQALSIDLLYPNQANTWWPPAQNLYLDQVAHGAWLKNQQLIVNISLQGGDYAEEGLDRRTCSSKPFRETGDHCRANSSGQCMESCRTPPNPPSSQPTYTPITTGFTAANCLLTSGNDVIVKKMCCDDYSVTNNTCFPGKSSQEWRASERATLEQILAGMSSLSDLTLNNTFVVVAAGNSGKNAARRMKTANWTRGLTNTMQ